MEHRPAPQTSSRTNVILLGMVSFINDTSSKIIVPILPLFIAQLGGAGLAVGLTAGLSDSAASLAKLFAGYWSDRLGRRKPFVLIGYALSALAKLLLAIAVALHLDQTSGPGYEKITWPRYQAYESAWLTAGRMRGLAVRSHLPDRRS